MSIPSGAWLNPETLRLPLSVSTPEAGTFADRIAGLVILLSKMNSLSGVSTAAFAPVPLKMKGLPGTGDRTPPAPTVQASVIAPLVGAASLPNKRSPAQVACSPASDPVPVCGNGDPVAAVSEPSALMR